MFLTLHLQLCIFDLVDRCEAACIARQSPGGHTCAREAAEHRLPAPSGTSFQSLRTFLLHPPTQPPPLCSSPAQALAWVGCTHPLLLKPLFPLEGLPRQMGMVCQSEGPLLLLRDGTTPAFHQTFQYRSQAKFWLLLKPWLPGPCKETSGWIVGSAWLSRAGNPLSALSPRVSFAVPAGTPDLYT